VLLGSAGLVEALEWACAPEHSFDYITKTSPFAAGALGPGPPGALKRPQRSSQAIGFARRFSMGLEGA
jgi:hypothetical protein